MSPDGRLMRFTRNIRYWAPVALWMLVIFWMSTSLFSSDNTASVVEPAIRYVQPSITEPDVYRCHNAIRKMAHVLEYFIFGFLLFRAFKAGSDERRAGRWAAYSFLIVALCAASDEFHQSFLSDRTAALIDVGIDALGGLLGLCVCVLCQHRREQRKSWL